MAVRSLEFCINDTTKTEQRWIMDLHTSSEEHLHSNRIFFLTVLSPSSSRPRPHPFLCIPLHHIPTAPHPPAPTPRSSRLSHLSLQCLSYSMRGVSCLFKLGVEWRWVRRLVGDIMGRVFVGYDDGSWSDLFVRI
ncbi:hypothetical protein BDN70DRAFT_886423 [Pholiota conissans]|uniref:Uncharacterized protein n=1 Tax=Pholiota conissans TaxID=109636 RepID=A0A9P6CN02_9AGAR|nr:hypothetical protein BDN70DRAFT_886423 [Pholiota conissans]